LPRWRGKISTTEFGSYTTFWVRPDGKPYGTVNFPVPLAECPGNRLVLYRAFERSEISQLEKIIISSEYTKLIQNDGQYYASSWIEKQLKPNSNKLGWLLLQAKWERDFDRDVRRARGQEFVSYQLKKSDKLSNNTSDSLTLHLRAINELRELGQFNEAEVQLDRLPIRKLNVRIPKEICKSSKVRKNSRPNITICDVTNSTQIESAEVKKACMILPRYFVWS
jgi:hypothetical protein